MTPRTPEAILKELLGSQSLQIVHLVAQVEALQAKLEELTKAPGTEEA